MNPLATDFSPSSTANTMLPSAEQAPRLPPVDRSRAVRLSSPYFLTREHKQQAIHMKKTMLESFIGHSVKGGATFCDSLSPLDLKNMVDGSTKRQEVMEEVLPRLNSNGLWAYNPTPTELDHLARKRKLIDLGASEDLPFASQEALLRPSFGTAKASTLPAAGGLSIDFSDPSFLCPGQDVTTNELQSIEGGRNMLGLFSPELNPAALTSTIGSCSSSASWLERQRNLWQLCPGLFQDRLHTLNAYDSSAMNSKRSDFHVSSLDSRRSLQEIESHAAPLQLLHPLYPDQSPNLDDFVTSSQTTSRSSRTLPKDQGYNGPMAQSSIHTSAAFTQEGNLLYGCTYPYRDHTGFQPATECSRAWKFFGVPEAQPRRTGSRRPRHKTNRLVSRPLRNVMQPFHMADISWLHRPKHENGVGSLLNQTDPPGWGSSSGTRKGSMEMGRIHLTDPPREVLTTTSFFAPQDEESFLTYRLNDSCSRQFKFPVANEKPLSAYIADEANIHGGSTRGSRETGSWSHSKSWISDDAKERMAFARILNNLRHIRADKSPFVPRSFSSFTAFKAEVAEANKAELSQVVGRRLKDLERNKSRLREGMRSRMGRENVELFGGLRFADKLSPVFAAESCFNEIDSEEMDTRGEWPSLIELKEESDGRGHAACGSWPLPRDHAVDPKVMEARGADIYNPDGTIRWHMRMLRPDRRFIRPVTPHES